MAHVPGSTIAHPFRAMGTEVALIAAGSVEPDVFARGARVVEALFAREERRCSRFQLDSELSRLNAGSSGWTRVSARLAEIVGLALDAAARTDGRFDPTVLRALESLGYDRDFDRVRAGAGDAVPPPGTCGRWGEVAVDGERVLVPEGVGLDLGGIAKGWTVDLAATAAVDGGLEWAIVNAGGDLRIAGEPPAEGTSIAIEDPADPGSEIARVVLDSGAIATSSVTRRAWGEGRHHVIDPRTGTCAATGVIQATAWAPTCTDAEVASKVALLEGPAALGGLEALLVLEDGRVVTNLPVALGAAA